MFIVLRPFPGFAHLTLDPEDRAVDVRPTKQLASLIYQWLCDNQMEESLQAIGGDSTNVNTGWKGGAIAHLETMLGRKMIWIICALLTNELPLRHLFISMDGRTVSDNKFEGPTHQQSIGVPYAARGPPHRYRDQPYSDGT